MEARTPAREAKMRIRQLRTLRFGKLEVGRPARKAKIRIRELRTLRFERPEVGRPAREAKMRIRELRRILGFGRPEVRLRGHDADSGAANPLTQEARQREAGLGGFGN